MFRARRCPPIAARFVASDSAAATVEYALVVGCVAVVTIVSAAFFGNATHRSVHNVSQSLDTELAPSLARSPNGPILIDGPAPVVVSDEPSTAPVPRTLLLTLMVAASAAVLVFGGRIWLQLSRRAKTTGGGSRESSVALEQRLFDRRQRTLRRLGNNTARLFQSRLKVRDLMSDDIAVVFSDTKRADLVTRMRHSSVNHVYVCGGDGRLLGIIRDKQLVRASCGDAAQCMDSNVPSIDVNAPVSQAVSTILNEHQSGLAVLEGGTLRGEITLIDLAIALQCFLQILMRMGQLVDSAAPTDDDVIAKITDLHSTQQTRLRALADQVKDLKDEETRGPWTKIHEEADLLVDSSDRLLRDVKRGVGDLEHRMRNLATMFDTRTDELTGIGNARALDESLARQCGLRKRYDQAVSLMLLRFEATAVPSMDADAGEYDQQIRTWATWLVEHLRETDVVARYADQVFAVVLPHTDHETACFLRDRLHKSLFAKGLGSATAVTVTAEKDDNAKEMIARGEQLLEQTGETRCLLATKA